MSTLLALLPPVVSARLKAVLAVVGAVAVALSTTLGPDQHWLVIVISVLTALGVYATPNLKTLTGTASAGPAAKPDDLLADADAMVRVLPVSATFRQKAEADIETAVKVAEKVFESPNVTVLADDPTVRTLPSVPVTPETPLPQVTVTPPAPENPEPPVQHVGV